MSFARFGDHDHVLTSAFTGVDPTDGRDQQAVLRPRAEVVNVRSSTEDNGEGCPPTSILLRADPRRDITKPPKQCFIQVTSPLLFLLLHFGFGCSDRSPSSSLPSLYNCVHIAALLASFHPSFCRRPLPTLALESPKGSPSFNLGSRGSQVLSPFLMPCITTMQCCPQGCLVFMHM